MHRKSIVLSALAIFCSTFASALGDTTFLISGDSFHIQFPVESFDGKKVQEPNTYREIELLCSKDGCVLRNRAIFPWISKPDVCSTWSTEHSSPGGDLVFLQRDFKNGVLEFEWEEAATRMRARIDFVTKAAFSTVTKFHAEQIRRDEAMGGIKYYDWRLPETEREVKLSCHFRIPGVGKAK